jgi:hypothetical protein
MSDVSMQDLKLSLERGIVKRLRRIFFGLAIASLALILLAYLMVIGAHALPQDVSPFFLKLMAALGLIELFMAWFVPEWTIRQDEIAGLFKRGLFMPRGYPPVMDRGAILSVTFIRYYLVRAAFLEAIAVEGFFCVMVLAGALKAQPVYWYCLAPCVLIPVLFMLMLPTEASLTRMFKSKMLK